MSRNSNVSFLVGALLILEGVPTSAVAQSEKSETAATRLAYYQVFKDPMNATCRDPQRRKVKTSKGYRWRWVC